ncbi:hypothetical protein E2C01_006112 [Portunus trituberculatus]|uniref:Uncharacterized protein n=1 Tax=Portunus trituberculatus TaxID=210409 RepID=A0A5B7CVH2_PORTR|nr:hypothetical protein [Portunus trituberculatus]
MKSGKRIDDSHSYITQTRTRAACGRRQPNSSVYKRPWRHSVTRGRGPPTTESVINEKIRGKGTTAAGRGSIRERGKKGTTNRAIRKNKGKKRGERSRKRKGARYIYKKKGSDSKQEVPVLMKMKKIHKTMFLSMRTTRTVNARMGVLMKRNVCTGNTNTTQSMRRNLMETDSCSDYESEESSELDIPSEEECQSEYFHEQDSEYEPKSEETSESEMEDESEASFKEDDKEEEEEVQHEKEQSEKEETNQNGRQQKRNEKRKRQEDEEEFSQREKKMKGDEE